MGQSTFGTVVVSAHALLRECLSRILSGTDFEVVLSSASFHEAAANLPTEELPILLILDVGVDQDEIIRQIKAFKQERPNSRVVLLAEYDLLNDANLVAAFQVGADAYFLQPSADSFVKTLALVISGNTIVPLGVLPVFLDTHNGHLERSNASFLPNDEFATLGQLAEEGNPHLTAREECILQGLIEGYPNKTIARRNHIAEATVKVHIKAIFRKTRVHNRTQAAIWAMNRGLRTDRVL